MRIQTLGHVDRRATGTRRADDAKQRVVVALADRVELVIVAAGAGDGQAQERLAEDVDGSSVNRTFSSNASVGANP